MNKKKLELLDKITKVEKYFKDTKYSNIVREISNLFNNGKLFLCEKELEKLPSEDQLLDELVEKLKGKSIYRTLEKIEKGEKDVFVILKGLSSLLTHCIIECKHNREYLMLVPVIVNKINGVIYEI